MLKSILMVLPGLWLAFSDVSYAQELSCKQGYDKTKLHCSVVADKVSVVGYQINRGRCSGADFNFPILMRDPRVIGLMSFEVREEMKFRIAQINHIIEGKAGRYRGFEPTAKILEMNDGEISGLFYELMDFNISGSGSKLSGELIIDPLDFTSELLSALRSNIDLPVLGTYHFGDQFVVNADCEILEVQFDTQAGSTVFSTY